MTPDPAAYPPGSSWRIVTRSASGESIAYCLACQAHDTLARLVEAGDELVSWGPDCANPLADGAGKAYIRDSGGLAERPIAPAC